MIGLAPIPIRRLIWTATTWCLREGWSKLGEGFDDLCFPRICPVCAGDADHWGFCPPCRAELLDAAGSVCPRCAMPVGPHALVTKGCSECRGRSLGYDAAVALGPYQGPIRGLCLQLKHEESAWLAHWVGHLVADSCRSKLQAEIAGGAWVVPIPLHWTRRITRGYNQAEEIALGLAKSLRLKVREPLRRPIATPALALLGRTERAKIMKNAFTVRRRFRAKLAGRTILLVDDILTSGATTGAASRALKRAGAKRVIVVVVGRAEGKP